MTLDEQIAIIQAVKDGKKVLYRPFHEAITRTLRPVDSGHEFSFTSNHYKIQREPMEIWVNVYTDGRIAAHRFDVDADRCLSKDGRTVKFREVLED